MRSFRQNTTKPSIIWYGTDRCIGKVVGRADAGLISCTTCDSSWKWKDRQNILRSKCNQLNIYLTPKLPDLMKIIQNRKRSTAWNNRTRSKTISKDLSTTHKENQTGRKYIPRRISICFTEFTEFVTAPRHCASIVPYSRS